jgi:hypothetical protein
MGLIQKAGVLVLGQEDSRRFTIGLEGAQAHHPRVLDVGVVLLPLLSPVDQPLQLRRTPINMIK